MKQAGQAGDVGCLNCITLQPAPRQPPATSMRRSGWSNGDLTSFIFLILGFAGPYEMMREIWVGELGYSVETVTPLWLTKAFDLIDINSVRHEADNATNRLDLLADGREPGSHPKPISRTDQAVQPRPASPDWRSRPSPSNLKPGSLLRENTGRRFRWSRRYHSWAFGKTKPDGTRNICTVRRSSRQCE